MKSYLVACLALFSATVAFCACNGNYSKCPSGEHLVLTGSDNWSCCDQTRHCANQSVNGVIFTRYAPIYSYTWASPEGGPTYTFTCSTQDYSEIYSSPCQCCGSNGFPCDAPPTPGPDSTPPTD